MFLLEQVSNTIRASQKSKHFCCTVPSSTFVVSFLKTLLSAGLINGFVCANSKNTVFLRYDKRGVGLLEKLEPCSKPGKKFLAKSYKITGRGSCGAGFIISSISGLTVLYTHTNVKKKSVGGEVLCKF